MKSLRDEMEIVNAYELVGTYRGAAALYGTTAKTVKRNPRAASDGPGERRPAPPREHNTTGVTELIAEHVRAIDGCTSAKRLLVVRARTATLAHRGTPPSRSRLSMFTVYCQWFVHENLPPAGRRD